MNALKLYREWDERRWLKWAKWWERKRANGRSHYVRWAALVWGGAMVNIFALWGYLSTGGFSLAQFIFMIPICLVGGWFVGAAGWASNEARYEKYLDGGWRSQLRG